MTIEDLTNLDLAYAPPFGSAKDPAIVAGMVAQNDRRGLAAMVAPTELDNRVAAGEDVQILDVREGHEFFVGAVPGAINIPLDEVRGRLAELDPVRPVIVYDANGQKAYWAGRILRQNGFANVSVLTGGFVVWSATQAARSFAPMF